MVSKTKLGATLAGVGAVLLTLGGWLNGTLEITTAISAIIMEVGGVLTLWGVRDWPILNKVK